MRKINLIAIVLAVFLMSSCAIKNNVSDGYQPGDIAQGAIDNYHLYCSAPFVGLRAVGRFVIAILGGVTIPDACHTIEVVAGGDRFDLESASSDGVKNKKVLPAPL